MKRLTSLLAATAFTASLLTGCSGGGTDDYCDALESTQKDFEDFESSDFSSFDEFTEQVQEFADDAPDEVKDDWKVLADALEAFVNALEEAGLEPSDLEGMQSGQLPEGVDMEALAQAMSEAEALGSEKFAEASENIEKHAKEECNIDLDAS